MSFTLYAMIDKRSPPLSTDELLLKLNDLFSGSPGFTSKVEIVPISKRRSIRLSWNGWSATIYYEEDSSDVRINVEEIERRLGANAPSELRAVDRQIQVLFDDDKDRLHDTQAINLMQFLERIERVILFDPRQNKIISAN